MLNPPKDGWSQVVMGHHLPPRLQRMAARSFVTTSWRSPFWGWENEGNRWCLGGGGLAAYFQTSWFLTPWAMFVKVCSLRESVLTGRFFFHLKEIFPAVSPLSPMSGWQSWIAKYGYTNWEQHVIYIYIIYTCFLVWLLMFFCVFANMIFADSCPLQAKLDVNKQNTQGHVQRCLEDPPFMVTW